MTQERKNQLVSIVLKDRETAEKYLAMTPEDVVSELKTQGYDFTPDEVKELGTEVATLLEQANGNELTPEQLEQIAGGKGEFMAGVVVGMLIGVTFLGGW